MPDLEKVIKGLEWILEDDRFGFGVNWENGEPRDDHEKAGKIITDALAMLKEQEAAEPKWTSVKERYPEEEGFYLVSADHGNYHPWIAEMRIFKGIKGFCNGAAMPCVGAWMPLPEPYKEGQ